MRRVVFLERAPPGEHLCAFGVADIALDLPTYASGATGVDLLWSALPVLALAGGMRVGHHCHAALAAGGLCRSGGGRGEAPSQMASIFQLNGVSLVTAAAQLSLVIHSASGFEHLGRALGRG